MYCPNCGSQVQDGAKFCSSCGQPVAVVADDQSAAPTEAIPAAESAPTEAIPAADQSAAPTEAIPAAESAPTEAIPAAESVPTEAIPAYEPDPTQVMPGVEVPASDAQPTQTTPGVGAAAAGTAAGAAGAAAGAGAPIPPTGAPVPPPGQYQQPQPPAKGPWYGKTWVIILFLLFLWPVGLVFMWLKSCNWQKTVKIVVTVLIGLCFILQIVNIVSLVNAMNDEDVYVSTAITQQTDDKSATSSAKSSGSTSTDSSASASATSPSASSSASASSSSSAKSSTSASSSNSQYLAGGFPSVAAILDLSGSDLASLCESAGMEWNSNKDYFLTTAANGNAQCYMFKNASDSNLSLSDFKAVKQFATYGTALKARIISSESNFSNAVSIMMKGTDVDASATDTEGTESLYLATDDAGNYVIVDATYLEKGKQVIFDVYNEAFIRGGYASDWLDGGRQGMSCSECFNYFAMEGIGTEWRVAG